MNQFLKPAKAQSDRSVVLDIAKGIGILLVVLGHNWLVLENKGEASRLIYSFHIPLFLFLSSQLIKDNTSIGTFILTRANRLLKPYLVVFAFLTILTALFPTVNPAINVSPSVFFFRSLYGTPGYIIWEWLPLWYIPHLFIALTISKIILQGTAMSRHRNLLVISICFLCAAVGIWITQNSPVSDPRPPFTSDAIPISLAIIMAGFLLQGKIREMRYQKTEFFAALTFFFLMHFFFDETVDLSLRIYSHPIISTIQIILGIYIVLSLSIAIRDYKFISQILSYIGTGSFFILLFHNFVQVRSYWYFSQQGYGDFASNLPGLFLGVALPLIFWEIAKRQKILAYVLLSKTSSKLDSQQSQQGYPSDQQR